MEPKFNHKIAQLLDKEQSENTRKAYRSDFEHFQHFCEGQQESSLPASVKTVMAYLSHCAEQFKPSVIKRRMAAIKNYHQAHTQTSPTDDLRVKRLFYAIKRDKGTAQASVKPILKKDIWEAIDTLDENTLKGLRDKCLLLIGFIGAFRRSELVDLDYEDLYFDEKGLTIHLHKSQPDALQEGDFKAIPFNKEQEKYCPVKAMQTWLAASGIRQGALFRGVNKGGHLNTKRISDKAVYLVVKQLLGKKFSAHSLRAGFIVQAKINGAEAHEIQRQTRHRSLFMIEQYTKVQSAWEDNAALKI
ncbi:tyrosine-type recombinase/integrase [Rapidithrix thailandica]|uniref:Tyrosine-type recombinase/integrase n=1 Tax=Rapidithrix thailandica TaxID=413964 RepID=A0AAW9SDD0_9BACT